MLSTLQTHTHKQTKRNKKTKQIKEIPPKEILENQYKIIKMAFSCKKIEFEKQQCSKVCENIL